MAQWPRYGRESFHFRTTPTLPPFSTGKTRSGAAQEITDGGGCSRGSAKSDPVALAHFYFNRAVVRSELGRTREAVADGERAIQLATGRVDQLVLSSFRNTVALQHLNTGEPKQALTLYLKMAEDGERASEKAWLFNVYRQLANVYLILGDFDRAQSYVRKVESLWQTAGSIRGYDSHGGSWHGSVEDAKARLFEARGQLENALKSYQSAEALRRGNIEKSAHAMIATPRNQLEQTVDQLLLAGARVKSRLGRIAEAESDARRALLSRLHATGKYAPATAHYIASLGVLLVEQGRYEEAKKLIAATIDIYREIGMPEDTQTFVAVLNDLASVQALRANGRRQFELRHHQARDCGGSLVAARRSCPISAGSRRCIVTHGSKKGWPSAAGCWNSAPAALANRIKRRHWRGGFMPSAWRLPSVTTRRARSSRRRCRCSRPRHSTPTTTTF